nr:hypothetical protein [Tanacetum cinerariifolium]
MVACHDDLSYIPPNNEQNKPTQGDISEANNKSTQAQRNEFEELYVSANEELYPGWNHTTPLDFMEKFMHLKVSDCKTSRWKDKNTIGKKVPNNVLCYFLIIHRLQHLYKSNHTVKHMTWHATGKSTQNGKMQHPVDGKAWKNFDNRSRSIPAIWLEKVVTHLIEPAIKGFVAASAVLKPERLKVDKTR